MPALDLNFGLSALANGAVQIGIILLVAVILQLIARWMIPKLIKARIPKIREESPEQLADRSKTLSRIIYQVVSVII